MDACTLEPGSHSYWACVPWSLCSERQKPPQWKPLHHDAKEPALTGLGKLARSNGDPVQTKKPKKLVKKNVLLQPLSRWCTDDKPPHPTVTAEA